jgi:hypothetical protein
MAKAKKKLLPKDFKEFLEKGIFSDLIAVFDDCEIDARGGYGKQTALAFDNCPDELAKWLVEQGADLQATDTWGNTPLHARSRSFRGRIKILVDLGADINSTSSSVGTPLHAAADSHKVENARVLIENGAKIDVLNVEQLSPLELALRGCSNIDIESMAPLAQVLLEAGAKKTARMKEFVEEIGKRFEFHRSGFNKDELEAVDIGLAKLYELFQVPAVPRRQVHNGKSAIAVAAATWQKQHEELWELLVPSSGPAETIQGELIRISGRIGNELEGNGGVNWDKDYAKMADAFLQYIGSGQSVSAAELKEATTIVRSLKSKSGNTSRMAELAVKWVLQNPSPFKLGRLDYKR